MPRLAPLFLEQADVVDTHPAIDRFTHIVNGEKSGGDGGQRFHFNAGAAARFGLHYAHHGRLFFVEREFNADAGKRERVRERNQVGCALGALDGGNARNAQHIAFLGGARGYHLKGCALHSDAAARARDSMGFIFGADIDHLGLAACIEVRECLHFFTNFLRGDSDTSPAAEYKTSQKNAVTLNAGLDSFAVLPRLQTEPGSFRIIIVR